MEGVDQLRTLLQSSKNNKGDGIAYFCIHPGLIRTELDRDFGWFSKIVFYLIGKPLEKGAQTHLDLLQMNNSDIESGEYYAYSKVTQITKESYDMELATRLQQVIKEYLDPYLTKESAVF